jgi:uncharacterized protein with PIN domain
MIILYVPGQNILQKMPNQNQNNELSKNILFRCYAELNDFLPEEKRHKSFNHKLKTPVTVGEAIQSLRIPFSEVDLVLVNSQPVPLSHRLFENDRVSLYPTFETLDIGSLKDEQYPPLRETKFILDAHLGKLAKYLRMLGFDTLYRNDFEDPEIIDISIKEKRIILTRDRLLLESKRISHGYFVRSTEKHEQLKEMVQKFDLISQFKSFTRCMTCNTKLIPKPKKEMTPEVPPDVAANFELFYYCPSCRKVYWKGSHFKRMEDLIRGIAGD